MYYSSCNPSLGRNHTRISCVEKRHFHLPTNKRASIWRQGATIRLGPVFDRWFGNSFFDDSSPSSGWQVLELTSSQRRDFVWEEKCLSMIPVDQANEEANDGRVNGTIRQMHPISCEWIRPEKASTCSNEGGPFRCPFPSVKDQHNELDIWKLCMINFK